MDRSPVLLVNSYAGSLLIAAKQAGHYVMGSYEDAGYGLPIQKHNYPRVNYIATADEWPVKQDLRGHIVLAHPPCAAFSMMNVANPSHVGVDTDKFRCTERVLDYAMRNRCDALAVESVPRALEGGRAVHDKHAAKHGYHVYRVLQNACTFGVPQWRPRFWCLFIRKDAAPGLMLRHEPMRVTPGELILTTDAEGEVLPKRHVVQYEEQRQRLAADFGKKRAEVMICTPGWLYKTLQAELGGSGKVGEEEARQRYCVNGKFRSATLHVVDPTGLVPTLTGNVLWGHPGGRPLNCLEYARLGGFPDDYTFPPSLLHSQQRALLSRGVAPPVAKWVLEQLEKNLRTPRSFYMTGRGQNLRDCTLRLKPGDTANFQPSRKMWVEELRQHVVEGVP